MIIRSCILLLVRMILTYSSLYNWFHLKICYAKRIYIENLKLSLAVASCANQEEFSNKKSEKQFWWKGKDLWIWERQKIIKYHKIYWFKQKFSKFSLVYLIFVNLCLDSREKIADYFLYFFVFVIKWSSKFKFMTIMKKNDDL